MEFEIEVITSLIGIAGLALVAIFSTLGYFYRGWVESKRSARRVLYLLLEIRYAIGASLFDSHTATKQYLKHYAQRLNQKGFVVQEEALHSQIGEVVEDYFSKVAETSKVDIEERLLQPFEEALSDLSQVSPVLAYKLRGKEKLELVAKLNKSYMSSYKDDMIPQIDSEWGKTVILEFAHEVENDALQYMSNDLDKQILLLGKHCGWVERFRCKRVLSEKVGEIDRKAFRELDHLIDKLVEKIAEASSKELTSVKG